MHHRKFSIKISRLLFFLLQSASSQRFGISLIKYMNLKLDFIRSFKQKAVCFHLQPTIGG